MERKVGTISRGIRCPIIRKGDDLAKIVAESVLAAAESEGFQLRDRDVVAVTESVVARAQGNYASVDAIAEDVRNKLGGETVGVIFPILSRNRFSICLRGIAMGAKKVVVMLSYPSDEVGNHLLTYDQLDEAGVNPWTDVLTEAEFRAKFGRVEHELCEQKVFNATQIGTISCIQGQIAQLFSLTKTVIPNSSRTCFRIS